MSLQKTILTDLTEAMKAQDAQTLGVLRMLKAAFLNESKAASGSDELADEQVMTLLKREAKKRKEAIAAYTKGNRPELAEIEESELAIIEKYLPEQMSDEDINAIIEAVLDGMSDPQFGTAMGVVMQKTAGQADGGRVKELLTQALQ
jgi:hypothetical protein